MRKKPGKLLSIVLAVMLLISAIPLSAQDTSAETSGEFIYDINDGGTATITGYIGSATELDIPSELDGHKVTSIGSYVFEFSSLVSITIPDSVTYIWEHAFAYCSSLTDITIPDSVTYIGNSAFYQCASLTAINVDSENKYYSSENGVLFNYAKTSLLSYPIGKTEPDYIIPEGVTSIGYEAFCNCSSLVRITIPNSVISIEATAFISCSSLESITIPEGVTYIGSHAFAHCSSLTSITIPDSVTSIGYEAFYYCASLTSITIPEGVITIGESAFVECLSLTAINVDSENKCYSSENGVLFDYAKTALLSYPAGKTETDYIIPEGVTSIEDTAFHGCSFLKSITIPEGVTYIGDEMFYGCSSLASITLPDSVTLIGNDAFQSCTSLTSITIPEGVTTIGEGAFIECLSLTAINVDSENKCYSSENGVLFDYAKTALLSYPAGKTETGYIIPEGVTSVGNDAFFACSNLASITMPNSVTSIGTYAFNGCTSLTNVTIPDSVTTIAEDAFGDCSSLEKVYYTGSEDEWETIEKNGNDFNGAEIIFNWKFELESNDVKLEASKSVIDEKTELKVTSLTDGSADELLANIGVEYATDEGVLYDISLMLDGEKVQPSGKVTVYIPVPEDKNGETCKVFHIAEDGTVTDMNAVYENGYMVFETDHFSYYALVDSAVTPGDLNSDGQINMKDIIILRKIVAGIFSPTDVQLKNGDLNGDGNLNMKDIILLRKTVAGVI